MSSLFSSFSQSSHLPSLSSAASGIPDLKQLPPAVATYGSPKPSFFVRVSVVLRNNPSKGGVVLSTRGICRVVDFRAISERRLKRHGFIDQNENVISLGLVISGVYSILDDDDILEDVLQNGDILMCALRSSSDDAVITGTTVLHTPNSTISNIKIFIQLTGDQFVYKPRIHSKHSRISSSFDNVDKKQLISQICAGPQDTAISFEEAMTGEDLVVTKTAETQKYPQSPKGKNFNATKSADSNVESTRSECILVEQSISSKHCQDAAVPFINRAMQIASADCRQTTAVEYDTESNDKQESTLEKEGSTKCIDREKHIISDGSGSTKNTTMVPEERNMHQPVPQLQDFVAKVEHALQKNMAVRGQNIVLTTELHRHTSEEEDHLLERYLKDYGVIRADEDGMESKS